MAILWKEEYSIGLETIDQQHKRFIEILNKLSESFLKQDRREVIQDVLKELEEYAENHFTFEEKCFHKFNYVNTQEHENGHEIFRLQIQRIWKQLENGDDLLEYEMLQFMNDWLIEHILKEDKKYVECFKKNGIL
jgi:hemerythrin-like metal-binding protein